MAVCYNRQVSIHLPDTRCYKKDAENELKVNAVQLSDKEIQLSAPNFDRASLCRFAYFMPLNIYFILT
jgi:hypothetical protein